MRTLYGLLGITGPIAADLIEVTAKCRAVAGVTGEYRAQSSVESRDEHRRQIVIHRAPFSASVSGKIGLPQPPAESGWPALVQGLERHLFQRFRQLSSVTLDPFLLLGWKLRAKNVRRESFQHRPAMRVRRTNCHALGSDPPRFLEP